MEGPRHRSSSLSEGERLVQPAQKFLAALAESPIDETKHTLGFGDGA